MENPAQMYFIKLNKMSKATEYNCFFFFCVMGKLKMLVETVLSFVRKGQQFVLLLTFSVTYLVPQIAKRGPCF